MLLTMIEWILTKNEAGIATGHGSVSLCDKL